MTERERETVLKMRNCKETEAVKKILRYALLHRGSTIVVIGRSYAKIKLTVVDRLLDILNPRIAKVDWTRRYIDICNGSRIMFGSVGSEQEARNRYGGFNVDAVFCDENVLDGLEATQIINVMKTRLRGTRFPLRFYIGAEEVRIDGGGDDQDPAAESETAAVPAVEG